MKSILDPDFEYTPSVETDIRATFERVRRELRTRDQSHTSPWTYGPFAGSHLVRVSPAFVHSGVRVKSIVNIDTHLSCMPMLTPLELLCAVSAATAFMLGSGPYRLASHSGRRAIPTKHAHRSKRFCGHGAHVGRQVNAGEPSLNHSNPHADISK
jgi:hypothetical protein